MCRRIVPIALLGDSVLRRPLTGLHARQEGGQLVEAVPVRVAALEPPALTRHRLHTKFVRRDPTRFRYGKIRTARSRSHGFVRIPHRVRPAPPDSHALILRPRPVPHSNAWVQTMFTHSSVVIPCAPNTFSFGNQTNCTRCAPGYTCSTRTSSLAVPCSPGTYAAPGSYCFTFAKSIGWESPTFRSRFGYLHGRAARDVLKFHDAPSCRLLARILQFRVRSQERCAITFPVDSAPV